MTGQKDQPDRFNELRKQAEKLITYRPGHPLEQTANILDTIHELQVHQAELVLQNEELLQAQLEISELQKEYAHLYENLPCGYITLNNKGITTRINLTAASLLDNVQQSLKRLPFSYFIEPAFQPSFIAAMQQSAESGEIQSTEFQLKSPERNPSWVLAAIDSKRDTDNVVIEWLIALTDITEQKLAEADLGIKETHYRTLLATIPDLVWLKDTKGVYLSCNSVFETFFGAKESEIIGKTDYDFVEKELADFFRAHDRKAMEIDQPSKNEEWLTFAENGYEGFFETIKTPMRSARNGRLIGVLGVARDITARHFSEKERILLEKQRRHSQKMEAIGNLAGGIAHDFNNILSSIIGYTELVLEEGAKDASQEDSLQEVLHAGNRAKLLVQQILSFARQSEETTEPLDLTIIADEVLTFLKVSLPTTLKIIKTFESTSLVMGNPTQLHQVLMNLCINACDAMRGEEGFLEVGLRDVVVDNSARWAGLSLKYGNYVELKVSDTGQGIDCAILDNIFEPYFTTKEVGDGTGMGLATVKGIIDSYGGEITVASSRNEKTVFSIYLPVTSALNSKGPQPQKLALHKGKERIMFIDDEPSIMKLGAQLLENLGYTVTPLISSADALSLFRKQPYTFDLVITDMILPHMTGDKLAMELRKIRPEIPVILCSGYSREMNAQRAAEIGINRYISKPFTRADFALALRQIFDGPEDSIS